MWVILPMGLIYLLLIFFQTLSQNESNDATASAVEGLCWFMQERSWCVTWERTQVFQRLAWEVGGTLEAGVKKKGFIPTKPKFLKKNNSIMAQRYC